MMRVNIPLILVNAHWLCYVPHCSKVDSVVNKDLTEEENCDDEGLQKCPQSKIMYSYIDNI